MPSDNENDLQLDDEEEIPFDDEQPSTTKDGHTTTSDTDKENAPHDFQVVEESDNENANDAEDEDLVGSIFGSDSDSEDDAKRQIEEAGDDTLISSDQRRLLQRKYILPEFHGPSPDTNLFFFKMPSSLKIHDKAYSAADYIDSDDLKHHSYHARWRYALDKDNQPVRDDFGKLQIESNAKIVRWSDGSYQLYVGGKKANSSDLGIYDVVESDMMDQHHHLFSTTKQAACSFDNGKFQKKFSFRPVNIRPTVSRPLTNRKDTKRKTLLTKARKLRDAELEEGKREVNEFRNKLRQKRKREDLKAQPGLSTGFLEEEEDADEESINQIKARFRGKKKGKSRRQLEEDDDYDDYEETLDEEDDEFVEYDEEDDSDAEYIPGRRPRKRQRRR